MNANSRRARRPTASRCGSATRRSPMMSRFSARMSRTMSALRPLEHALLQLVEPGLELLHLGPVVIHHQVDDAVHQRDRAPRRGCGRSADTCRASPGSCASGRRASSPGSSGRGRSRCRASRSDAAPRGNRCRGGSGRGSRRTARSSGAGTSATASSTASGWKWKVVGEDPELFGRRGGKIHPQHHVAAGAKPFRLDRRHAFGDVLALDEDGIMATGYVAGPDCRLQRHSGRSPAPSPEPAARSLASSIPHLHLQRRVCRRQAGDGHAVG